MRLCGGVGGGVVVVVVGTSQSESQSQSERDDCPPRLPKEVQEQTQERTPPHLLTAHVTHR